MSFAVGMIGLKLLFPNFEIYNFVITVLAFCLHLFFQNTEATVDKDCRCFNKKAFMEETDRLIQNKEEFIIIGIDIDHFNRIHALYHYNVGNEFLREIVQRLDKASALYNSSSVLFFIFA